MESRRIDYGALREREKARALYKPEKVKVLFIGESPSSAGTFFYFASGSLYRHTQWAFSEVYGSKSGEAQSFLAFFKEIGCYLDDLCLVPVNNEKDRDKRKRFRDDGVVPLAKRIEEMQPHAVIVVMKDIRGEVSRAIREAGLLLSQDQVVIAPFPGHNKWNKQAYVKEVVKALRALIGANILKADCPF